MPVEQLFMLDTNILSALIKNPAGPASAHLATLDNDAFCTSMIVACELRYGVNKKASPMLTAKVEKLLAGLTVLPLEGSVDVEYARIRCHLEQHGQLIRHNDLFIAAHALSCGAILVTDNTREFSRVPGLRVENWLEA